jgi:magnesium transporter
MARFFKKRDKSIGLAPGSLVFIGEQKTETTRIRLMDFDKDLLEESQPDNIDEIAECVKTSTTSWVNIDGLHDTELVKKVGKLFDLHPLLLEDMLNTGQRPKLEDFDNCLFLSLKMLRYNAEKDEIASEQLSLVLGKTFLLTFQERPGDVFDPVRERIRKHRPRIRQSGVDYLAYALLDTVVDNYIYLIERLGERIEDLEDELFDNPTSAVMEKIHNMKREMNYLRKSIRPAREAIVELAKSESDMVNENIFPFLKDLQDLATQATEAIDIYRDMLTDDFNIYVSTVSNKMNDVMKVLTIFAAIFIPLTFVAGVYGTNFKHLPELEFKYSYPIFWGVLIIIGVSMVFYFRRKKWL